MGRLLSHQISERDVLQLHYGKLEDGTEFDSLPQNQPFVFSLGTGKVTKGWDQKAAKECVREVSQKLMIPSELGYGA